MSENAEYVEMDLLRLTTAGSVDDGKSTLIGRLLYDSKSIFEDQLEAMAESSRKRGDENVNLALVTDGLRAEREQGITIDVAYRYFATPRRKFIIADTPGHIQYTRNMVTGASTASLAIILIDHPIAVGIAEDHRPGTRAGRKIGAAQLVPPGIFATAGPGSGRLGAAGKKKIQRIDRIGQLNQPVVVSIRRILAGRGATSQEEKAQGGDHIGHVDAPIGVPIPTYERISRQPRAEERRQDERTYQYRRESTHSW